LLITDQVGIHREVSLANAGLISNCGVEPLAERMERLLGNDSLRRGMGANALDLARREFTVTRVTGRFLDFYRSLSSGCEPAPETPDPFDFNRRRPGRAVITRGEASGSSRTLHRELLRNSSPDINGPLDVSHCPSVPLSVEVSGNLLSPW